MNEESFERMRLVNDIVKSLIFEDAEDKYLQLYLNDSDLKKECDKVISSYINDDIFSYDFVEKVCLKYLNNVVKPQLKEKPYLLNINVITNSIEEYINKIFSEYNSSNSESDEVIFNNKFKNAKKLLDKIDNDFVFDNINPEYEERFANIYINRIKNNNTLSKEQVEELLSFTVMGGFILKHEEYTDIAFEYALKTILKNDYKIDKYLYKKLFLYICNKISEERNIKDLNIEFREQESNMSYSDLVKTIFINSDKFVNNDILTNLMSFFHELRHYEQYNGLIKEPLTRFLCYKDIFLSDESPYLDYYMKNYDNLFVEKDAYYTSYKYVHDFIEEKEPLVLPKLRKKIYNNLMLTILLEEKNITERRYNGNIKDVNVLFEELVKDKKRSSDFYNKLITSPLIIEYDIRGNKRSIFELLESKDYYERNGLDDRCEIINYLLYEESVSMDYITENLKHLENNLLKEKYSKYYKEAKKVLKHKLIKYKADTLVDKKSKLKKDDITFVAFYDTVIDRLRKKNIKGLHKSKNIELYREKEDELRIAYKWLYNFSKEIEEEKTKEKKEDINHKIR